MIINPLDHAMMVSKCVMQIPLECALGFGASICQRTRSLIVPKLDQSSISEFDMYWGKVWQSIANLDNWSEDVVSYFESLVPNDGSINDDNEFFAASTMFYSFSRAVDQDSANDVSHVSEASIALLDNSIYKKMGIPPNFQNDLIVHANPLISREIERQMRDMLVCQTCNIPRDAICEMWKVSSSESLKPV